jgi:O-antigen ligase
MAARHLRSALAPAYLLLCLILGGSGQGIWANMLLQLTGIAIIAWSAAVPAAEPLTQRARQLLWIALIALAVIALQLVPLPASVWPHLGGRAELADGYRLLGLATPSMQISLVPYASLATLLKLIPPIAVFCAIVRLKAYRPSWLALALVVGTFAGILLGVLQVANPDPESSHWYPYAYSNFGVATGFFANANHMAILLVVTLPFVASLVASMRGPNTDRYSGAIALGAGAALVIVVGLALNRSLAGYGLGIPVLLATLLIIIREGMAARHWIAGATALLMAGAVTALVISPAGERGYGAEASVSSRAAITETTLRATADFLPLGSGLGTFRPVYRLYEDHERISVVEINHAHNDYAELILELGVAGIILILLFLAWWVIAVWRVWSFSDSGPFARAASIASAAILVHSIVDFPLRTAAISAVFAMCLALLTERPKGRGTDRPDLWPTRHVVME